MKIITITVDGPVPKAGLVILSAMSAEGGRTSVGVKLVGAQSPETLATALALNMTARPEWPNFLKASAKGNTVRVACPDDVNNVNGLTFVAEYNPDPEQRAGHVLHPDWVSIADEAW